VVVVLCLIDVLLFSFGEVGTISSSEMAVDALPSLVQAWDSTAVHGSLVQSLSVVLLGKIVDDAVPLQAVYVILTSVSLALDVNVVLDVLGAAAAEGWTSRSGVVVVTDVVDAAVPTGCSTSDDALVSGDALPVSMAQVLASRACWVWLTWELGARVVRWVNEWGLALLWMSQVGRHCSDAGH